MGDRTPALPADARVATGRPRSRVLFVPDYSHHNPYQRLLANALAEHGVRVHYGRRTRRGPASLLQTWLARGCPEVVHIHWTHEFLGIHDNGANRMASAWFFGQLRLLREMRVRIVWTVHNLAAHEGGNGALELASHRRLVDVADAVICHCRAARDAAIETLGLDAGAREKLHVIPHGSYAGEYPDHIDRATARQRLGLNARERVFLFIGALRAYKGVDDLILAFRGLCAPDARLVIAGRAARPEICTQLRSAAGSDPRIRLCMDFIPPDELQVYLRACDVVVLPFRDILTSGSAILALSFGRPVIAPAIGCLPETIPPDAGLLYAPGDPDGLAKALRDAVDINWSTIEASALSRARELSWRSIAAQTADLYRRPGR